MALGSRLFIVSFKVYLSLPTRLFGLQITGKVVLKPPVCNGGFVRVPLSSCQSFPVSTTHFWINLFSSRSPGAGGKRSWVLVHLSGVRFREAGAASGTARSREGRVRRVHDSVSLLARPSAPLSTLVARDLLPHPLLRACLQFPPAPPAPGQRGRGGQRVPMGRGEFLPQGTPS